MEGTLTLSVARVLAISSWIVWVQPHVSSILAELAARVIVYLSMVLSELVTMLRTVEYEEKSTTTCDENSDKH
jgi:hypothetical protein